jgi:hypothetical protein
VQVLRTPEDRLAGLPEFGYPPRYAEVANGLRMGYVVPLDDRTHPGIVRFGDLAQVAHIREGSAGPLQGAVDGRDRGPKLCGSLGGTEIQYLAEDK